MFIRQARMVSIYLIVDEKGDFKEEKFPKQWVYWRTAKEAECDEKEERKSGEKW